MKRTGAMLYRNGTHEAWRNAKPFRYVVIDDFLQPSAAEGILCSYPKPNASWNGTTFIHQRKKFSLNKNLPESIASFFATVNGPKFVKSLSAFTGIESLLADADLHGGGCHQIVDGGFLDVHIDFNRHPENQLYRRLNLILYLNKGWKARYGGYLELWDMEKHERIANIAPTFNRMVMFETNEISYHGHPVPLSVPHGITRKSLAVYYYTEKQDETPTHNTLFVNVSGVAGSLKNAAAGMVAIRERGAAQIIRRLT